MSDFIIDAQLRTEFGKGAARRLRRASSVPAVLYGHDQEPLHIALPERLTMRVLRMRNALVEIKVAQDTYLGLVKDVQRDPVLQIVEHVDFLAVKAGEKVVVDIPLHIVGEPAADTQVHFEQKSIEIEADVNSLPDFFEISVAGLLAGSHVLAKDIVLPKGVTLVADLDILLVNIVSKVASDVALEDSVDEKNS